MSSAACQHAIMSLSCPSGNWQEKRGAMDRGYKSALHRYVAAYIDLNHASLDPGEEAAADAIGQFYQAADELSRKKEEKYGSFEIPNLDEMLNRDEKVSKLALSRIRAAVKRGCADRGQLEEMEEAYSYAMFLERGKIKEEIPS